MLLEGKKAIITGGTRGIGYAIACRFIEEGAAVTVFGSRQETADAAVEKLAAAYPEAKVWGRTCDLTSLEAVTEAFTEAAADMGGLDTVVNNAGISQRSPLLEYTAEEFAKVMDLNVVAVFNGHQAAAKIMAEAGHGGTITTTSSQPQHSPTRKARCLHQPQAARLLLFEREAVSRNSDSDRDAASLRAMFRKERPVLNADSGIPFPQRVSRGNCIPL